MIDQAKIRASIREVIEHIEAEVRSAGDLPDYYQDLLDAEDKILEALK